MSHALTQEEIDIMKVDLLEFFKNIEQEKEIDTVKIETEEGYITVRKRLNIQILANIGENLTKNILPNIHLNPPTIKNLQHITTETLKGKIDLTRTLNLWMTNPYTTQYICLIKRYTHLTKTTTLTLALARETLREITKHLQHTNPPKDKFTKKLKEKLENIRKNLLHYLSLPYFKPILANIPPIISEKWIQKLITEAQNEKLTTTREQLLKEVEKLWKEYHTKYIRIGGRKEILVETIKKGQEENIAILYQLWILAKLQELLNANIITYNSTLNNTKGPIMYTKINKHTIYIYYNAIEPVRNLKYWCVPGIPDYIFQTNNHYIIADAKTGVDKNGNPKTDDIYKILGYLTNFYITNNNQKPTKNAIIFYPGPQNTPTPKTHKSPWTHKLTIITIRPKHLKTPNQYQQTAQKLKTTLQNHILNPN